MPVNKVKRRGSYAPLSSHYYKDDKLIRAGEKAEMLYVRGLAFCADVLNDGFITDAQMAHVAVGLSGAKARAKALVDVGAWERGPGGYFVVAWLRWNKSRESILEDNRKDADRKGSQDADQQQPPAPPPEDEPDSDPWDDARQGQFPVGVPSESDRNPNAIRAGSHARGSARAPSNPELEPELELEPEPSLPLGEVDRDNAPATAAATPSWFETFWQAWPRKVGKPDARKKFDAVVKRGAQPATIVAAAEAQAEQWRRERKDPQFIPHPATWLNQERYNDDVERPNVRPIRNGYVTDSRGLTHRGRMMDNASDVVAERQALATTLLSPEPARELFLAAPPGVWADWQHAEIARTLRTFYDRGWPIDSRSVLKAMSEHVEPHRMEEIGHTLADLALDAPPLASLPLYLDRVRSLAALRAAHDAATRFRERLERIARSRDEVDYAEALADLRQAAEDAESAFASTAATPPMSLDEMLGITVTHDWLVPGLLERTDRLVLTGHEGRGKTEIVAQFATTIAAGLHPFSGDPLPERDGGYRVLVVDAENSQGQCIRRYRRIAGMVDQLRDRHGLPGADWRKFRQRMLLRPEGVELSDPRELSRIDKAVELSSPDVLVIGPIYKLTDADVTDAQGAKTLVSTLDRLRVRHQCVVISEGHAGHGSTPGGGARGVRPFGSSIFLRWPEFGYGLQASEGYEHDEHPEAVDLVPWRGAREERNWPGRLRRGTGVLPWYPDNPSYFDTEMALRREDVQ